MLLPVWRHHLKLRLHGFSDASEDTYSAVVYLRTTYDTGTPTMALVAAKTKVAPLKRQSIPRLELCGAQLLANLLTNVRNALNIDLNHVFAWSDSTIVLHWLDGSPKRFKTFVGNRVSAILDLLPARRWRHVPTETNPADCASRGLLPKEMIAYTLWWKGPPWLLLEPPQLPPQPLSSPVSTSELKAVCHVAGPTSPDWIEDNYSSYMQLLRITAWIFCFIANLKAHKTKASMSLFLYLRSK